MNPAGPQQNLRNWVRFVSLYIAFFIVVGLVLLFFGREEIHRYINQIHSPFFDYFFAYATHLGDGLMFIPLALGTLVFSNVKNFLRVLLAGALALVIAGVFKHFVFSDALRPVAYFGENHNLRLVDGVTIHMKNSFPSGHALTAFCLATLLAGITQRWAAFWFFTALVASFSRVYLSQHFLIDIWAGSLLGVFIGAASYFLLSRFNANWLNARMIKPKTN